MNAWKYRMCALLLVACGEDPSAEAVESDAGRAPDGGLTMDASSGAVGVPCSEAVSCITPTGQQGMRACLNSRLANECVFSDAGLRDAQAASDGAAQTGPCPSSLTCDDALASLSALGLADDAGVLLACGSLAKDPLLGLGDVFQPPSCRSKADCLALGLDVPCQTFRSYGDRCTRSCTR